VSTSPSSDLSPDAVAWLARFAVALGRPAPTATEIEALLALAGAAAHASHRQAAPVACYLAAAAGISAEEALSRALLLD
jgi:Domain of unknown function (DUF6457)